MYITLRKKIWLPIKWWFKEKYTEKTLVQRHNRDVLQKKEEVKRQLLLAERNGISKQIEFHKGQLDLINWLCLNHREL